MQNFRDNLKLAMRLAGLSQRGLAEKADLSYPYVNRVLTGKSDPTLSVCDKIADALGLKLSDLITAERRRTRIGA